MTEQGSNFEEKGKTEMMNVQEVARPTNIEPSEVKESE